MFDLEIASKLLKAKGFEVGDFGHYDRDGMGVILKQHDKLLTRGFLIHLCTSSNDYLSIHLLHPPFFVTTEMDLDSAIEACEILYRAHLAAPNVLMQSLYKVRVIDREMDSEDTRSIMGQHHE